MAIISKGNKKDIIPDIIYLRHSLIAISSALNIKYQFVNLNLRHELRLGSKNAHTVSKFDLGPAV